MLFLFLNFFLKYKEKINKKYFFCLDRIFKMGKLNKKKLEKIKNIFLKNPAKQHLSIKSENQVPSKLKLLHLSFASLY